MKLQSLQSQKMLLSLKKLFEESQIGEIETVTGASGGVMFTPTISGEDARSLVEDLCKRLSESDRILPGGYLYLSDFIEYTVYFKKCWSYHCPVPLKDKKLMPL